jgi:energy-coupling factor transporter ATP-binding protein EcfA2
MIKIKSWERVTFVGATGCGKTVLAKFLLSSLDRVIVIDPKHTFKMEGFRKSFLLPWFSDKFHMIVRPKKQDDERLASLLFEAWKRKNMTIYVDECASIVDSFPMANDMLQEITRTGRERGVGVWNALQRPKWIPKLYLSESETFFIFTLRSGDDRDYMSGYAGEEVKEKIPLFYFWYIRPDELNPCLNKYDPASGEIIRYDPQQVYEEMNERRLVND